MADFYLSRVVRFEEPPVVICGSPRSFLLIFSEVEDFFLILNIPWVAI